VTEKKKESKFDASRCSMCRAAYASGYTMCIMCAEKDMAEKLGAGSLDLPADWYDYTPDRGPQ
jgi:hypothetical protein